MSLEQAYLFCMVLVLSLYNKTYIIRLDNIQGVGEGMRLSQHHNTELYKRYAVALISPYAQY